MKNLIIPLACALLLGSCNKTKDSPYAYEQSNIYSTSNNVNFGTILLDLRPYVMDNNVKKYVVSPQIKNVSLKVDKFDFGANNSLPIDTSIVAKDLVNNRFVTTEDIKYPVIVNFKTDNEPITTAGQYSDLLNNYVVIGPGFYNCRIYSFDITKADNTTQTVYTNIYHNFEVRSGMGNIYFGTFEVLVK